MVSFRVSCSVSLGFHVGQSDFLVRISKRSCGFHLGFL